MKRTTQEARQYFAEQGCELLEDYKGSVTKMKYRCKCGEIGHTSWNNFTRGKRCGHCAKCGMSKKRSLEEVQAIFRERGCEFLDDEFKGVHHKHCYRCSCGVEAKISFTAFHFQKQSCRACGLKKMTGSNNPSWRHDREKLKLEQKFRKKCYKALQSSLAAVGKEKVGRTSDMLGYGPKELQEHVTRHRNWPKVKNGSWHLDHIFPIQAFLDHGIIDIKLINCLENLRPITQKANNQKRSRYDPRKFSIWLQEREL